MIQWNDSWQRGSVNSLWVWLFLHLKCHREYFEEVDRTWETFEQTLWSHISNFFELAKERYAHLQSCSLLSRYLLFPRCFWISCYYEGPTYVLLGVLWVVACSFPFLNRYIYIYIYATISLCPHDELFSVYVVYTVVNLESGVGCGW